MGLAETESSGAPGAGGSRVTRLAPSPTGALHLGNARTFLINWAMARANGWRIVLRIEDLDSPRTKAGAAEQAMEDLAWLGLDWDEGPVTQLADLSPYHEALARLNDAGMLYRCECTRSEIAAAQSAPHGDGHDLRYPGTCRPATRGRVDLRARMRDPSLALRVRAPDEEVSFEDGFAGRYAMNVQAHVGDFVVATKAGLPAYQLAVVVDDARQGVTDIVRGDDLLSSTARQIVLYRLLGAGALPRWYHLPLVLGPDGHRLAKRHGDTRISLYRSLGVGAERVVGLLAKWSGVCGGDGGDEAAGGDEIKPMHALAFAERFSLSRLPRGPVTMTEEDEAWLRS